MPYILGRAVTTNSLVSRLIRLRTGSQFSHVEFRMDEDWSAYIHSALSALAATAATQGRHSIPAWLSKAAAALSALPQGDYGVVGAHLDTGVAIFPSNYDHFTKIRNFRTQVTKAEKLLIISAACAAIGDKYCVPTIIGDVLEVSCERANEFDCSVFMNESHGVVRYLQEPVDGEGLVTPRDIVMSPLAELDESISKLQLNTVA